MNWQTCCIKHLNTSAINSFPNWSPMAFFYLPNRVIHQGNPTSLTQSTNNCLNICIYQKFLVSLAKLTAEAEKLQQILSQKNNYAHCKGDGSNIHPSYIGGWFLYRTGFYFQNLRQIAFFCCIIRKNFKISCIFGFFFVTLQAEFNYGDFATIR